MEPLLFIIYLFCFYIIKSYSAGVLGFCFALLSNNRKYLNFIIYWGINLLIHIFLFYFFFREISTILAYIIGQLIGRLYYSSYYDNSETTGKRSSRWFRHLRCWRLLKLWFGFEYLNLSPHHKKLDDNDPLLITVHPHGFIPIGIIVGLVLTDSNDHIFGRDLLFATTRLVFWIPILREICLWSGGIIADRDVMINILKKEKRSLVLSPGGVGESCLLDHTKVEISFEHWGFLEVALKANVSILPVFSYGENRIWVVFPGWRMIRRRIASICGYAFPTIVFPFLFPHQLKLVFDISQLINPSTIENKKEIYRNIYLNHLIRKTEKN